MKNKSTTYKISEPITLNDLRWLVEQTKEWPSDCLTNITGRKEYDPREYDPATISVTGVDNQHEA